MSAKFRAKNQSGLHVGFENEVRSRSDENFPQFTKNELKTVNLKGAKGKRVKMPFCKYKAAKFENYARRNSDPGSDTTGLRTIRHSQIQENCPTGKSSC